MGALRLNRVATPGRTTVVLAACAIIWLVPSMAAAWNPLQTIADAGHAVLNGLKSVGSAVGGLIGAPFGGIVNSLATPTIETAESSGHRLIQDVNDTLGKQIDHVDGAAKDVIAFAADQIDHRVATQIEQVNGDLSARIVQITSSGDHLIGRVDDAARRRIDQVFNRIDQTGRVIDASVRDRLDQVDGILDRRTAQVQNVVASSVTQVDRVLAQRLEQADEIIGKRIGSVDVVITKQAINAEGSILRIGALLAAVAFIAFVLWRIWQEVSPRMPEADRSRRVRFEGLARVQSGLKVAWKPLVVQVGMAAVCVAALFFLSWFLTIGPRGRARSLSDYHERALASAAASLDLTAVRYHAAQLQLLDTDDSAERRHHAIALKAELMRATFARPTLLQSPEGVRELMARVEELERAMRSEEVLDKAEADPDVETIKAHIVWQVGLTQSAEIEAARLCARAIETARRQPKLEFHLQPLAEHYVRIVAGGAVPSEVSSALATALKGQQWSDKVFPQLQHLFDFDRAARRLDESASPAFVSMIEAHAEALRSSGKNREQALEQRTRRAVEVIAAWRDFDSFLQADPWVAVSNVVFRSFKLNDVQLSHALWFEGNPRLLELPPLLMQPDVGRKLTPLQRVRMAPLRIAWFDRYAPLLADPARRLLAYEESQRYRSLESRTHDFEAATVAFLSSPEFRTPNADGGLERLHARMEYAAASAASLRFYSLGDGKPRKYAEVLESLYAAAAATAKGTAAPVRSVKLTEALASYDLRDPSYASY